MRTEFQSLEKRSSSFSNVQENIKKFLWAEPIRSRFPVWSRLLPAAALGSCLLLGAGCSTTGMKGTPFYTGEYSKREGPAEDRVNLWPLVYYRPPGLSAIWPIFEKSDTHFAIRPLYSVYGLDQVNHKHNVLWPLAQFDRQTSENRIFPFFWGGGARPADDYCLGFPLYWHYGHPLDNEVGGLDSLFPLWWVDRHGPDQSSVFCPWPLVGFMHRGKTSGWHVFPLAGSYGDGNAYFRFQAAFLADQWGNAAQNRHGSLVLPLYFYARSRTAWDFYSLPWSGGHAADHDWSCILPVYYHSKDAAGSLTLTPLWLQGASANPAEGGWAALLPLLYHSYSDKASTTLSPLWLSHTAADPQKKSWSALLPVYYHSRDNKADVLLTPLWLQGASKNPAEGGWKALLPLLYHSYNDKASTTLSPLWLSHTAADPQKKSWSALLPAFYHSSDQASDLLLTPLWMQGAHSNNNWQLLPPLYYARQDGADKFWATPLGGLRTAADLRTWMIYPLLSWGTPRADGGEFWALAPLAHADWNASNSVSHVLPLYYYNSATHTALTPLWARWAAGGTTNTMIPPALSWASRDAASTDLWLALGLGKFSWGAKPGADYLLPLFYNDREKQMFLSAAWARWVAGGTTNAVVPPALSWVSKDAASTDLWLALGLGKFSWGARPGADYLLPIFYSDRERQKFVSLLWAGWPTAEGRVTAVPPALSWKTTTPQRSDLHVGLGLGKFSWGEKPGTQWLLPIFYQYRAENTFLSLLWARYVAAGRTNSIVPPTLSWLTADAYRQELWLALGLAKFSWGDMPTESHVFPLYYHDPQTHEFYTPLFGRDPGADGFNYFATPLVGRREGEHTGSWAFPLYSHKRDTKSGDVDDWVLWGNHWERGGVSRSIFFPVFGYHNFGPLDSAPEVARDRMHYGKDFFCIPFCWYRNEAFYRPATLQHPPAGERKKAAAPKPRLPPVREEKYTHGVFPVWSYAKAETPAQGRLNTDGSVVLWLYDYTREVAPLAQPAGGTNDYTRARILWHLWHYERSNGDVTVDLFPGITYDHKIDGFKKISWLWRVFRYERDKDGGKKLDLLGIPFMRSAGKINGQRTPGS
jgi:hypothetical protein